MNTNPTPSDQDISLTLPVQMGFKVLDAFLKKKFKDTNISHKDDKGNTSNYFKILDLKLEESDHPEYNLSLKLHLQPLTLLFNNNTVDVSVLADLKLDVATQKLYVEAYDMDSSGKNWVTNTLLKTVLNTFIYKKVINTLSIDLMPIVNEKIALINAQLASKLKTTKGISIMGNVASFTISHFEIKKDVIWVLIHTQGWGVISIDDLEL
ncbi:uncharacterized protein DUF4403 [Gelidibacter sediminis]|uniref:Uncharacterized protein DUF4403 n=1 Tax=Gelidibacter sediminis TaxID=1608710 RepID=A0A4R7PX47_9FLAO|nr:DUF4403 family protein [Gelidibacter sediminis]TDU39498.1 uncharacterized protein DUF4403 [Gelidibacter sediminis]